MSNEHWCKAFFKQEIISVSPLTGGRQHQIDLITLVDQSKWVCKKFCAQTWLGATNELNLEFTEALAARVASELGITFAAYKGFDNNPILTINKNKAIIIPYCEGKLLPVISEHQAFLLGSKLAQLHLLNLPAEGAKPFPAITLPEESCVPRWLAELVASCNFHRQYEANKWLLSHRDMHASNLIWRDAESPHLIDWESAGFIHPAIELVGLAVNCAGLALCCFAAERFHATLMGYGQCVGKLPKIDTTLWDLTLHTWLLWFAHCLRQDWRDDAEHTLQVIVFIRDNLLRMQQIYAKVYAFFNESKTT